MRELFSEIEIGAPAERVWEVLMDFASYPDWNPFVLKIEGEPAVGERLSVTLKLEGRKPVVFKPRVEGRVLRKEFRWQGRLILPGLFDGEHTFQIESLAEDKVRFVQKERFRGILAPSLLKNIQDRTMASFEAMNRALKARAES
jgi:hypothetical protein